MVGAAGEVQRRVQQAVGLHRTAAHRSMKDVQSIKQPVKKHLSHPCNKNNDNWDNKHHM